MGDADALPQLGCVVVDKDDDDDDARSVVAHTSYACKGSETRIAGGPRKMQKTSTPSPSNIRPSYLCTRIAANSYDLCDLHALQFSFINMRTSS